MIAKAEQEAIEAAEDARMKPRLKGKPRAGVLGALVNGIISVATGSDPFEDLIVGTIGTSPLGAAEPDFEAMRNEEAYRQWDAYQKELSGIVPDVGKSVQCASPAQWRRNHHVNGNY